MATVLIVDDQDLVRAGLRALLTQDSHISVVGEADTGAAAVRASQQHRPDVILWEIRMPGMDGIDATRRICADPHLHSRVVILTTFDDDEDILDAVRAGAAGYLLKDTDSRQLRQAVLTAAQGENLLSPQIARKVMEHIAALPDADSERIDLSALTQREIEVLTHIGHGRTNAEIAGHLNLSPATARTYVSRILAKLQARDRTELAVICHRAGLYQPNFPYR